MSTSDIITGMLLAFLGGSMFLLTLMMMLMIWDDYQDNKKSRKSKK